MHLLAEWPIIEFLYPILYSPYSRRYWEYHPVYSLMCRQIRTSMGVPTCLERSLMELFWWERCRGFYSRLVVNEKTRGSNSIIRTKMVDRHDLKARVLSLCSPFDCGVNHLRYTVWLDTPAWCGKHQGLGTRRRSKYPALFYLYLICDYFADIAETLMELCALCKMWMCSKRRLRLAFEPVTSLRIHWFSLDKIVPPFSCFPWILYFEHDSFYYRV